MKQKLKTDYFTIKKQYKKLIKRKHREYKNNIYQKIQSLDPKLKGDFWKLLDELRKSKIKQSNNISSEEWISHFKNLLFDSNEQLTELNTQMHNVNDGTDNLNSSITVKEIHEHISKLKMKKATGLDGIHNEMLKHGRFYLVPLLHKLFNNIFSSGIFPPQWNLGLIIPIYKNKGDPNLPSNYRGITLSSCLGKLFTSILQTRYYIFLEKYNKLNMKQFGFRKNSRTTDNLFILQHILHKYFRRKEKIYACFIDYEQAFDTVWQKGLVYKLSKIGVKGNFLQLINSMYSSITSSIKVDQNSYSQSFQCNRGIMQGDSLSPLLFTTFISDIPTYLQENLSPDITLENENINCLMFADDLILLSRTAEGLQKSLNTLATHAKEWKLKVNTSKSNIMIFCANGHFINKHHFTYDNHTLNTVDKQSYLGLVLTPSGRFSYARETLCKKARKTLGYIRSLISNSTKIPILLLCKLFDSLVKPVLLYGCEVWGTELLALKTDFDKSDIEQTHLKFCKQTLGVPFYTSTIKVRAELGRFPLSIMIKTQIAKYFLRLKYNIDNPLLKAAFNYSTKFSTNFNYITANLTDLHKSINKENFKVETAKVIKEINENLQSTYRTQFFDLLIKEIQEKPNKLCYGLMKKEYTMEHYLSRVHINQIRNIITKFRVNAHKLRINSGAYEHNGGPIPTDERICKFCNLNIVENETHFIIQCTKYQEIREIFIKNISVHNKQFSTLTIKEQTLYILNSNNEDVYNLVGKFLLDIYKIRK